jgi:multicomponent Na+:H+ antiporter subunit E
MNHRILMYIKRWPYFLLILSLWFLYHLTFDLKTIIGGILASLAMTIFTSNTLYGEAGFRFKGFSFWLMIRYFFVLMGEIFKAAWFYSLTIFKRDFEVIVFDLVLDFVDPIKVAFVANSITLTPGTVSIDVNDNTIKVMALVSKGTPVSEVEKPIRERFEQLLKEHKRGRI